MPSDYQKSSSYPPNQLFWDYSLLQTDTHTLFDISCLSHPITLGGSGVKEGDRFTFDGPLQQCSKTPLHFQDYPSNSKLETTTSWSDWIIKGAMISSVGI